MFLHLHFSQAAMRRVFALFDKDGNGEIDRAELQQVFLELGKFFTEDEVRVRNVWRSYQPTKESHQRQYNWQNPLESFLNQAMISHTSVVAS